MSPVCQCGERASWGREHWWCARGDCAMRLDARERRQEADHLVPTAEIDEQLAVAVAARLTAAAYGRDAPDDTSNKFGAPSVRTLLAEEDDEPTREFACAICKTGGGLVVLCDGGCGRGFHTHCVTPRLAGVPSGDWSCPDCVAAGTPKPPPGPPCERNPLCSRGFRHRGVGGPCKLPRAARPARAPRAAPSEGSAGACERHPQCTRGFRHGGAGGPCRIPKPRSFEPGEEPVNCQRSALCSRGYKHRGLGGPCNTQLRQRAAAEAAKTRRGFDDSPNVSPEPPLSADGDDESQDGTPQPPEGGAFAALFEGTGLPEEVQQD